VKKSTDPAGTVTYQEFDAAGRRKKLVEGWVSSGTDPDQNRTTHFAYNVDGLLTTLTADNATTANQTTTYVYGSAFDLSGTPQVVRKDLLRAVIYPDSTNEAGSSSFSVGSGGVYDRVEYKYNRLGDVIAVKDQNETVHEFDYDDFGRRRPASTIMAAWRA
jgi:YD repeat-containing protein